MFGGRESMSELFISYRRNDSSDFTGRLFDALRHEFGCRRIFRDVDSTPPGADYPCKIKSALHACKIMLVIIGHEWLGTDLDSGARRIEEANDYVKFEVSKALELKKDIVPVLINNAAMPTEELPSDLKSLSRLNACQLRSDPDFRSGFKRLCERLNELGFGKWKDLDNEAYETIQRLLPTEEDVASWCETTKPDKVSSKDLAQLNYDGFELIRQVMIVDYRRRRQVPLDQRDEKYSPVIWTRHLRFKRKLQNQNTITFRFQTEGIGVDFRCRNLPKRRCSVKQSDSYTSTKARMVSWEFSINIADFELGREHDLITDARIWNSDQDTRSWAGCTVNAPMEQNDMWLLFPNNRLPDPEKMLLHRIREGGEKREKLCLLEENIELNRNGSVIRWQQNKPLAGHIYEISFYWY